MVNCSIKKFCLLQCLVKTVVILSLFRHYYYYYYWMNFGRVFLACCVWPVECREDPRVCWLGQVGLCALLCLSCLAVPYDPIEAKPLCQEEISGVTVQRCMEPCFNYTLQTLTPRWAHCWSHTHTKTHKNTVMQAGITHQSCTRLPFRKDRTRTEDADTLLQPQPPADPIDPWFPSFCLPPPPTLLLSSCWSHLKKLCSVQMLQFGGL